MDYYPLSDLLYRSVALTDDNADVVEAYDTDAYGNTLVFDDPGAYDQWFTDDDSTTKNPICPFIFTGRRYDPETEIYFYRARYYHTGLGRFLSRDPAEGSQYAYAYVKSQPAGVVDPQGLQGFPMFSPDEGYAQARLAGVLTEAEQAQRRMEGQLHSLKSAVQDAASELRQDLSCARGIAAYGILAWVAVRSDVLAVACDAIAGMLEGWSRGEAPAAPATYPEYQLKVVKEVGPPVLRGLADLFRDNAASARQVMQQYCEKIIIPKCPCFISRVLCDGGK